MKSLIYDIEETREFVNRVLLNLESDEVYILLLNTRKKYCPVELSRSEEVLGRELIRDNDTDRVLRKIKKVTCASGIYVDMNTLKDVSLDCMATYVLLDPRSTLKGYHMFMSDINKWIYESFVGESKNLELYRRIDIKLFSAIHKNRSRNLYFVIDIDKKDESILDSVIEKLKGNIRWISETHGGYHLIVDKNYDTGIAIYKNIVGTEWVEILKEPMTPVPGTLQGGFGVVGIRRELWE